MPLTRRAFSTVFFGGAAAGLLAACAAPGPISGPATQAAPAAAPTAANALVKPRAAGAPLTAVQATSELALGRNRFAVGLIDERNQPVVAGTVTVEFFKLQPD